MLYANDVEKRDGRDGRDHRDVWDGREDERGPSWPERVLDALRRIFVPDPQPVPVPVVVRPTGPIRRRAY
jgi:hypothetical protein